MSKGLGDKSAQLQLDIFRLVRRRIRHPHTSTRRKPLSRRGHRPIRAVDAQRGRPPAAQKLLTAVRSNRNNRSEPQNEVWSPQSRRELKQDLSAVELPPFLEPFRKKSRWPKDPLDKNMSPPNSPFRIPNEVYPPRRASVSHRCLISRAKTQCFTASALQHCNHVERHVHRRKKIATGCHMVKLPARPRDCRRLRQR